MTTPHPQEILAHIAGYMQEHGVTSILLEVSDEVTRGTITLDQRHCPVIEAGIEPVKPYVRTDGSVHFGLDLRSSGFGPTIAVTFDGVRKATDAEVTADKKRIAAG